MAARAEDIDRVLADMRSAIDSGKCYLIPRKKNLDTLAQLGITWQDAKDEIYGLVRTEYVSGPSTDRDRPSSDKLWVFKKNVLGQKIYIKFKVEYLVDGGVKFLSFHIDEV